MKLIKTKKQVMAFSIIESMVVIVIGSILVGITSLNFTASENRAKITGVKNNMSSLQTMLETYAAERDGTMPDSMATLQRVASIGIQVSTDGKSNVYWKELKNPFTSYTGPKRTNPNNPSEQIGAYSDMGSSLNSPQPVGGSVIYNPVTQSIGGTSTQTSYYIYGAGRSGSADIYIRKQEDNNYFVVTNND